MVKAISKFIEYKSDRTREIKENEIHLLPELLKSTGMTD